MNDEPHTYDEAVHLVHRAFCDPEHELVGEWDRSMADALHRNGYAIIAADRLAALGLPIRDGQKCSWPYSDCHFRERLAAAPPPPLDVERDAIREKAIAFGIHDAADLLRHWGYVRIAERMRREALDRYARLAAGEPKR